MKKSVDIRKMVVVAVLCALAFLCMFVFRIKVGFLTFDAKDAIISIISLLYGPVLGVASALIVALLEFISVSDTGVYGLIMNFISSGTFALVCGLIYKYRRSFSGAIVSVVLAAVSVTAIMMAANLLITPYYMGVSQSQVAGMIPTLLLPFNLVKSVLNAAITMAIYKPFTLALRKTGLLPKAEQQTYRFGGKTLVLTLVALAVIVAAVLIMLLQMDGSFELFRTFTK